MSDADARIANLEKLARSQLGWRIPTATAEPAPVVVAGPDKSASELASRGYNLATARARQLDRLAGQWIGRLEWLLKRDPDLAIAVGERMRDLVAETLAPTRFEAAAELVADGVEWDPDEFPGTAPEVA